MPSASAQSQSPGWIQTPCRRTGTSRWPAPRLAGGIGHRASARMPTAQAASSARSRTQPSTTTPAQPFCCASAARLPPTSAVRCEPPPSITSTLPSPLDSSAARTSELSSKHCTVLTLPQKAATPPNSCQRGGRTRNVPLASSRWASHRSQVDVAVMGVRGVASSSWHPS